MKCPQCDQNGTEWEISFYNGICGKCYITESQTKRSRLPTQGAWSRVTGVERAAHGKDILQPLKKDGTINKHFVQAHGTQSLQKELKMSAREIHRNVEKYG